RRIRGSRPRHADPRWLRLRHRVRRRAVLARGAADAHRADQPGALAVVPRRACARPATVVLMTTAAVLLAAGGGTRFHGDGHKLLTVLRGRPVYEHALAAARAAALDELVVVLGAVELDLPADVTA